MSNEYSSDEERPAPVANAPSTEMLALPEDVVAPYYDALHKLWLQHSSNLYEFVNTHTMPWPAGCVTFTRVVQAEDAPRPADYTTLEFAVGVNSYCKDQVGLNTRFAALPFQCDSDSDEFVVDTTDCPQYSKAVGVNLPVGWFQPLADAPTQVERLPQALETDGQFLAVVSGGQILTIDRQKRPNPVKIGPADAEFTSIAWSPSTLGRIAAVTNFGELIVLECGLLQSSPELIRKQCHDETRAESVSWHSTARDLVATAGADGCVRLVDCRTTKTSFRKQLHRGSISAVSFHPNADFLFSTASKNSLRLWDMRKLNRPVAELVGHTDTILGVEWAPFSRTVLLSYGIDHTVLIWDLSRLDESKVGEESNKNIVADPQKTSNPELVFKHLGHTAAVRQATWCPFDLHHHEWTVASVDDNNTLQLWSPSRQALDDEGFSEDDD